MAILWSGLGPLASWPTLSTQLAGEYLAVWSHDNGSDDDVHGRRVSASGDLLGVELSFASGTAAQQKPAVAADEATAGYVVAWQQGSSNADVHACVLSSRGQQLGAELTLAAAANTQQQPALSYDAATGRVLAVWADSRNSATYPDVYGQLYRPLQADFSGTPTSGDAPLAVQFTDASASEADAWRWSFGDGNVTTTQSPLYTYTQAGLFTVTLRVTDTSSGEVGERVRGAYVLVHPVADFSGVPTSGEAPLEVTFTDGSTSGVEAWRWRFGDGATSTETNPVHSYSQAAAYTVTLRVTDTDTGEWDELTRTVYITASPVASFSGSPLTGTAPLSVQFTDGSTAGVEEWNWRFGDGMTDTMPSPAHLYTEAGAFTVTLQVTDTHTGEWDELARPSYVTVAPVAGFSATPTSGPLPLVVTFTDSSTPGVDAWHWSFGDGGESTAPDPVYTYTWVGAFTVTLRVTDTHTGEEAVTTGTITVTPLGVDYTYDPLGRLVAADYTSGIHLAYEYDAAGNRVTLTETSPASGTIVTASTFDAANQLTQRTRSDGWSYSYDWSARGELLAERTLGQAVRSFTWNAAGQLVEATVFTVTTHFTYTGDGVRTAVAVEGRGETHYLSGLGGQVLVESTGVTATRYLYGHGCLGEVRAGAPAYYLADGQGYVRQTTDGEGAVVDGWLYTPDGGIMSGPAGPVSHLVCGGIYDASTGLIYRGGRYFDPTMGIWLALGPLAVIQGWRERKRKKGRRGVPWYVLVALLVLGVAMGGVLTACETIIDPGTINPLPSPTPVCMESRPFGPPLGKNAVFMGTEADQRYESLKCWTDGDMRLVEGALTSTITEKFGGMDTDEYGVVQGFDSWTTALIQFGVSEDAPITLLRSDIHNGGADPEKDPFVPAAVTKPFLYIYDYFFDLQNGHDILLAHEMGHYWDQNNNGRLSSDMKGWINWGLPPTERAQSEELEDLPEAVELYFYWHEMVPQSRAWTDDPRQNNIYAFKAPDGLRLNDGSSGCTGPDPYDVYDCVGGAPDTNPRVKDRWDWLQLKFGHPW